MFSRLLQNISWLAVDRVIRLFGELFIGIWVARYLGPKDYGVLNYAIAFSGLFLLFVKLGLDQIIVRELVKKPKLRNYLLGTAFYLKLIGAIIAIALISLSLVLIETDGLIKAIILIISLGFIFQAVDVVDYFYQAKISSKKIAISRSIAFVVSLIFKVVFIINDFSVIYFAVAVLVEAFLVSILLLFVYINDSNLFSQWRFSNKIAIGLLKASWPLAISIFLISVHMKIDQVMIGNLLDSEHVGIYAVAVKLSEAWYFIPAIIIMTLTPYFVDLRERNYNLYNARLIQLYSFMFWLGILVGVLFLFIGQQLVILLYGQSYEESYVALVINIWNGIFISQALARGIWLISEDLQKYRLYNNLIIVFVNIIANLLLIPRFGIAGAAIATFLTQSIGTWGVSFIWKPLRKSTWAMMKSVNPLYLIRS